MKLFPTLNYKMETKEIGVLSLFCGYGTDNFALKRIGIPYKLIGYSDIDKYANQCFKQNHCPNDKEDKFRLGDVRLINPNDLPDFDLLTGGFPCQAFSNAGKMLGEAEPRGTLFYEIIRIAEVKKPKYMLLENVKGLTCKKFQETFNKILSELNRIGYNVYWKVLNSKDFGIPQSRARVFFVCFRKDIDEPMKFQFPEPIKLKIFIKDILEEQVDKKYYLSQLLQERFKKYLEDKETKIIRGRPKMPYEHGKRELEYKEYKDICPTLSENCAMGDQKNIVAMRSYPRTNNPKQDKEDGRFQNFEPREDGCSNSLTSVQKDNLIITGFQEHQSVKIDGISNALPSAMGEGGGHTPVVYDKNQMKWFGREIKTGKDGKNPLQEAHRIYDVDGISQTIKPLGLKIYDRKGFDSRTKGFRENELSPTLSTKMGTGGNNVPMVLGYTNKTGEHQSGTVVDKEGIAPTIYHGEYKSPLKIIQGQLRRLTPKECFRLMGFLNDEIDMSNLSDTQCYRLAGNGQDVNLVSKIFKEMFKFL